MQPIYCTGTIRKGALAGKPCRKYLGKYTAPYETAPCTRCGKITRSEEGSATEHGQVVAAVQGVVDQNLGAKV